MIDGFKTVALRAGDRIDAMTTAGQDMLVATLGDVRADLFDQGDCFWCPIIVSDAPGTGGLPPMLDGLRSLGKPVKFVNVINARLRERLTKEGFEIIDADERGEVPPWAS